MKVKGFSQVTEAWVSPVLSGEGQQEGTLNILERAWWVRTCHQPRFHPERCLRTLVLERRNACLIHGWCELGECLCNLRDRLVCTTFVLALGTCHTPTCGYPITSESVSDRLLLVLLLQGLFSWLWPWSLRLSVIEARKIMFHQMVFSPHFGNSRGKILVSAFTVRWFFASCYFSRKNGSSDLRRCACVYHIFLL